MKNSTTLLLLMLLGYFTVKAQVVPAAGEANKPQSAKPLKKHKITQSAHTVKRVNSSKTDSGSIDIPMVLVQGGSFIMGDGRDTENPKHQVTLSSFYIGKFDITQAQWTAIMGSNPSAHQHCNTCPVESVNWDNVQEFIKKLNAKTGKTYRLPTEAEWEYAAKGGNQSKGYTYSGSNDINAVAWYDTNDHNQTQPVGQKQANELGIYDMSGNVWQWCQDWFDKNYYNISPAENPPGPAAGNDGRVVRGGSWGYLAHDCRVAYRNASAPNYRLGVLGFRLVLVP